MMETTLVERFGELIGFAIVAGLVVAVGGMGFSQPKLVKIGGYTIIGCIGIAFLLALIDEGALNPILDAIRP